MRLVEFYNPEFDEFVEKQEDDTRKAKLTLEQINKLRKYRELQKAEEVEHKKFVKVMYNTAGQEQPTL